MFSREVCKDNKKKKNKVTPSRESINNWEEKPEYATQIFQLREKRKPEVHGNYIYMHLYACEC